MEVCKHKDFKEVESYKDVAGLRFVYKTKECRTCHKQLWDMYHEAQFHEWLNSQKQEQRDRFIIQKVQIGDELSEFAEQLAHKHHCNVSNVYRSCLALYFVLGDYNPEVREYVDSISILEQSVTSPKKFVVNPSIFVRMDANAKLFDMHMNEVAAWIIQRVLIAAKSGEAQRGTEVLSKIEYALEAA